MNQADLLLHLSGALADSERGCMHIATVAAAEPAGRLVGVLMLDTGDHTGRPPQLVLAARCGCHVHLPLWAMVQKLEAEMGRTGCVDHAVGEYTDAATAMALSATTH